MKPERINQYAVSFSPNNRIKNIRLANNHPYMHLNQKPKKMQLAHNAMYEITGPSKPKEEGDMQRVVTDSDYTNPAQGHLKPNDNQMKSKPFFQNMQEATFQNSENPKEE